MNDYKEILEQIMKMQSWASQKPFLHVELMTHLQRTRAELERLWIKTK